MVATRAAEEASFMLRRPLRRPILWSSVTAVAVQLFLVAAAAAASGGGDFPLR